MPPEQMATPAIPSKDGRLHVYMPSISCFHCQKVRKHSMFRIGQPYRWHFISRCSWIIAALCAQPPDKPLLRCFVARLFCYYQRLQLVSARASAAFTLPFTETCPLSPECDFARNNGPRLGGPPRPPAQPTPTPTKPPPAPATSPKAEDHTSQAEAAEALQLQKQQQGLPIMDAFAGGFVMGSKGACHAAKQGGALQLAPKLCICCYQKLYEGQQRCLCIIIGLREVPIDTRQGLLITGAFAGGFVMIRKGACCVARRKPFRASDGECKPQTQNLPKELRTRVDLAFEAEAAVEYAAVAARLRRQSGRLRSKGWAIPDEVALELLRWKGRRPRSSLVGGGAYVRSAPVRSAPRASCSTQVRLLGSQC
eukprot:1161524-Pelagomonas_calceolata.AAC.4